MSKNGEHLSEVEVSSFVDGELSKQELIRVELHLSKCSECHALVEQYRKLKESMAASLQEGFEEEAPPELVDRSVRMIKSQLRLERLRISLTELGARATTIPKQVYNMFERLRQATVSRLEESFASVTPRFATVFGEHDVVALRPFGLVLAPLVFRWRSRGEVDAVQYRLSIRRTEWSIVTAETEVRVDHRDIPLVRGEEYIWELLVLSGGEQVERTGGFFQLATDEAVATVAQFDSLLGTIKSDEERFTLRAAFLEEMKFYIDAAEQYEAAYELHPHPGIAHRIATCYDKLELEELREEWNARISS